MYASRAGNSNRVKTRYDQPIFHLIGGADYEIRVDFLPVRLGSPHSSGSVLLSVLARRPTNASDGRGSDGPCMEFERGAYVPAAAMAAESDGLRAAHG